MKIVFMGTPDFAVASLDKIFNSQHDIVGVITAPDKPSGRGQKMRPSPVKVYAEENNLNLLQPTNLKDEDFIKELQALKADLFVVVAFRMLPAVVFEMPEKGTINLHGSLLPDYRGAAPINWAVMNGEKVTGATTFFIEQKIDTGAIIDQIEIAISDDMTAGELHDDMMIKGAELLLNTLDKIETGDYQSKDQPKGDIPKKAYKIFKDTCRVDWNLTEKNIHNHIRGLSPYPAAWSNLNVDGKVISCKILQSKRAGNAFNGDVGEIIFDQKSIFAICPDGCIEILRIQPAGKKAMNASDFINGFKDKKIKFES